MLDVEPPEVASFEPGEHVVGIRCIGASVMLTVGCVASGANAIVINNVAGALFARSYGATFDAVVQVNFGSGFGSGTLIAPDLVLTAKHVVDGISVASIRIHVGDNDRAGSTIYTAASVYVAPDIRGTMLDGSDFALVRLTTTVPGIAPLRLIDITGPAVGRVGTMVGYGFKGVGSTGATGDNGDRWAGDNVIDYYGAATNNSGLVANTSNIFSTDFDDGTSANNKLGYLGSSSVRLPNEATTANGDSGGPLIIYQNGEPVIIGVLTDGTTANSPYGDISWWTGTTAYRDVITQWGGSFVSVPEPVWTYALFPCVLLIRRRRF